MKTHLDSPQVSVIVPSYNHASYIKERLDSIVNQTFQDFELIILDDSSSDNSVQLIREVLAGIPYQLIVNSKNSGSVFKQWAKGVGMAQGELIWIAESDDTCDHTFLSRMVSVLSDKKIVLAYCQSMLIDENANEIYSAKCWTDDLSNILWANDFVCQGEQFVDRYMIATNPIPNASAVVFRKKEFDETFQLSPSLRLCGDWLTWVRIADKGCISFIAECLNKFRCHQVNVRSNKEIKWIDEFQIVARYILNRKVTPTIEARSSRNVVWKTWTRMGYNPISPGNLFFINRGNDVLFKLFGYRLVYLIPYHLARSAKESLIKMLRRLRMQLFGFS